MGRGIEQDVVRHECVRRLALDDGVATFGDEEFVSVVHVWLGVVVHGRRLRQARQDIETGQRARRALDALCLGSDRLPQGLEEFDLALKNALIRPKDLPFEFLEGRRDEPFAARDGLLAVVVLRYRM